VTRLALLRHLKPVHGVLMLLGCAAVVIPILSNLGPHDRTVEAHRAYVTAERPIDRILAGTAMGSRRITPPDSIPQPQDAPPLRRIQPTPLMPPRADAAPDLSDIRLAIRETPPVVEAGAEMAVAAIRYPEPRPKPDRPEADSSIMAELLPPVQALPPIQAAPVASTPPPPRTPASPRRAASGAPRIALVVTAAGLSDLTTRSAIATLPDGITLAFAPIGENTARLAQNAVDDGHTILVEIPMEPINRQRDPGEPLTLRVGNSSTANIARLDQALSRFPGAAGVSSYLGARFSRSDEAASPVMRAIAARKMFFFENQPNRQSRLHTLAKTYDVPYSAGHVLVDAGRDEAMMLRRLSQLERQARQGTVAIGIVTAYRDSIATLGRWVTQAQERGVVFVPVTRLGTTG